MNAHIRCALLGVSLVLAALPAAAQTWSGLGGDNNWSTGANWVGGVAPASGATTQLVFPGGTPRFSPVTDAPWTVNSMNIQVAYTLSGQPITLAGTTPGIQVGFRATVANPIVLTGATVFSVAVGLDLTGGISGTGPLTLVAVGGVGMSGTNTYTGGTTIASGGFGLSGSMLGPVTVNGAGSSLVGTNGTVNGPVVVDSGGTIGGTLATGDLSIAGIMNAVISGPAPGQYSSIRVTGTTILNNATLNLGGTYVPAESDVFILIDNDGTDPIVGTFVGLGEGALITVNGVLRRLSYVGGTGNDVTLGPTAMGLAQNAPTLSEWAIILLSLLMLSIGMAGAARTSRPSP